MFAVLSGLGDRTQDEIKAHVQDTLGELYILDDVLLLKQIGLEKFPVNATHKIMKPDVQKAVMNYVETRSKDGLLN
jgi:hypothetical protein